MERYRRIASLALPIIGAMVSQNVMNLVDTAFVGSLGDEAIAATTSASFLAFASTAFVTGLSPGVQALAARRVGEGRRAEAAVPLGAGLLLSFLIGVPVATLLYALAPFVYPLVNDDPAVVAQAVPFLQVRMLGIAGVGVNFAFRGFWSGIDRTRSYLGTLLTMHAFNALASWALIFGHFGLPALGSLGAAWAWVLATWLGSAVYLALALVNGRDAGFPGRLPDRASLRALLGISLPSSVQQILFMSGLVVMFGIISRVGTREVAAAGVLVNVTLVAILPAVGLGLAATTLVGQALGRGDPADAARWAWDVVKVGVVGLAVLGVPFVLVPELLLAPFLPGRPETVALAAAPLRLVGATMWLDGIGSVLMHALLGAGAARFVAVVAVGLQWGLILPLSWVVGPWAGGGLFAIWGMQALGRLVQAVVFARAWAGGRWRTIRI